MTDFKPLLWPFVLAASVAVSPAVSNAADSAIKLPEAVLLDCKAQAEAAHAGLKAKIDAAAPTAAADLTAKRLETYASRIQQRVDICVEVAGLEAETNVLKARANGLKAETNALKAETNVLKAEAAELEKVGDKFEYLDAELSKQMAFFDDFLAGKKSREQYNTQLAGLPKLMKDGTDTIRDARKLYANDPKMLARLDRIEANFRKIAAFAPAGAVVSQSGSGN